MAVALVFAARSAYNNNQNAVQLAPEQFDIYIRLLDRLSYFCAQFIKTDLSIRKGIKFFGFKNRRCCLEKVHK